MKRMGSKVDDGDLKLLPYGSRKDRAALSIPPLIGCGALVYLFGPEFLPFRAPAAVVAMIAASFIVTLWWLATYKPRVRGDFGKEVQRVYRDLLGLGLLVAGISMPFGGYGLACIGAYVGYLGAFTYARTSWRGAD